MICTGDMLAVWAPPRYCCAQCSHYTGGRELPRHCSQPGPLTLLPTHSCYMWLFFLGVLISYLTTEVESCFAQLAPPSFIKNVGCQTVVPYCAQCSVRHVRYAADLCCDLPLIKLITINYSIALYLYPEWGLSFIFIHRLIQTSLCRYLDTIVGQH